MTPELTALALAGLLQAAQFILMAVPVNLELGSRRTAGPRDNDDMMRDLSPRTGRLVRALNNHFEGLILFTLAVVVVTLSDQSTTFTTACAWTYLIARVLYVPAYAFGWNPGRSIIWGLGFFATVAMILASLF
jgi:uncharacterized MAPEG superfamily protein